MAIKHRTKAQKQTAARRRLTYSLPTTSEIGVSTSLSNNTGPSPSRPVSLSVSGYDIQPGVIKQDLIKTVFVSLVVLGIELGLYFYLQG